MTEKFSILDYGHDRMSGAMAILWSDLRKTAIFRGHPMWGKLKELHASGELVERFGEPAYFPGEPAGTDTPRR